MIATRTSPRVPQRRRRRAARRRSAHLLLSSSTYTTPSTTRARGSHRGLSQIQERVSGEATNNASGRETCARPASVYTSSNLHVRARGSPPGQFAGQVPRRARLPPMVPRVPDLDVRRCTRHFRSATDIARAASRRLPTASSVRHRADGRSRSARFTMSLSSAARPMSTILPGSGGNELHRRIRLSPPASSLASSPSQTSSIDRCHQGSPPGDVPRNSESSASPIPRRPMLLNGPPDTFGRQPKIEIRAPPSG